MQRSVFWPTIAWPSQKKSVAQRSARYIFYEETVWRIFFLVALVAFSTEANKTSVALGTFLRIPQFRQKIARGESEFHAKARNFEFLT